MPMTNILKPLEPPYPADVDEILSSYPQQDDYILSLFRTFANSLRFLKKGMPNLLDKASPLPLRIREIIILRITANKNCEYEWGVHVTIFSKAARFSPKQVAATRSAEIDLALWSEEEAHLLQSIDELCETGVITETTLAQFQAAWTCEQQLEILALCGAYHTVSFVANTARLPGETFGAKFPK